MINFLHDLLGDPPDEFVGAAVVFDAVVEFAAVVEFVVAGGQHCKKKKKKLKRT